LVNGDSSCLCQVRYHTKFGPQLKAEVMFQQKLAEIYEVLKVPTGAEMGEVLEGSIEVGLKKNPEIST